MATVHFGRLDGAGGFSRVVAIKRLLPHLLANSEFTEMLLKEARLAARVAHVSRMDFRRCQSSTASPAEPGGLPFLARTHLKIA